MAIKLGERVRDDVFGIDGIAMQRCEKLYGGTLIYVEGRDAHGYIAERWIDEARLKPLANSTAEILHAVPTKGK